MAHSSLFSGIVAVTRSVLCWCSACWFFTFNATGQAQGPRLLPFLVGSVGVCLAIRLYLRKERTVLQLCAFCSTLGAVLTVVLALWFSTLSGAAGWIFGALAVGSTVYLGGRNCLEDAAAERTIAAMELTTLYFLAFLWGQSAAGMPPVYSIPLLLAVLLSLVEVCALRLAGSRQGQKNGLFVVIAVLAAIFLLMGLFLAFGAESLSQVLLALTHAAIALWKWATNLLYRLLLWFFSLLPDVEVDASVSYAQPELPEIPVRAEPSTAMTALLIVMLAGAILWGLFMLLRHLGSLQVGGKVVVKSKTVHRERFALVRWLRDLLRAIGARMALEWTLLRHRNSPQALYVFLLRSGRSLHVKKQRGESPAAFIRRMAELTGDEAHLCSALLMLAGALEEALYAPAPVKAFPAETACLIRRCYRRSLRQARMQELQTALAGIRKNTRKT